MAEEAQPLLPSDEQHHDARPDAPSFARSASRWQITSPRRIVMLVTLIKFSTVASGMMLLVPLYRLIEDMLCHVHYDDPSGDIIDEMKCKVQEVQSRLAFMLGWFGLLSNIISLVVAFPYGILSDKIGRRPTLILSCAGLYSSFFFSPFILSTFRDFIRRNPYFLMWGYVFQLIGGGVPVLLSTLYAIATDVSTEQEKARSFIYLTFGATAGGLAGPVLAGILMKEFGPWVPIYCAMSMTPFMIVAVLLIPETLQRNAKIHDSDGGDGSLKSHFAKGLSDMKDSLKMLSDINVPLILLTFFIQTARFAAYTSTLTQHISAHFGWTLAETSLLLSPYGFLNLIILAALPRIGDLLISPRFGFSTVRKDLFLTRVANALLIIGALVEGVARGLPLFLVGLFIQTLGAADSPLARATLIHYFDPAFTSRMYALLGMSEILGSFLGGPVLAALFDIGLRKKGGWIGLPWFYVAALCTVAMLGLVFVRIPKDKDRPEGNNLASDTETEVEP